MRNLVLLFSALVLSTSGVMAVTLEDKVATRNAYTNFNDSFIFVENGITFSVFPDGEFDFYIDDRVGVNANVNFGRNNITFNSGFDYNPFVQYDDFGAVIQIENIPIFYDFYGRVNQIGDVNIRYNSGRISRLGGMQIFYDNRGFYNNHRGFINIYNQNYVFRPFHSFFARPAIGFCLVNVNPYRRFYSPIRYTYYNPYQFNSRRTFATIGRAHRFNAIRSERANVYRNDTRVAVRSASTRNTPSRNDGYRVSKNDNNRNAVTRSSSNSNRNAVTRSSSNADRNAVTRSSSNSNRNAVTRSSSNADRNAVNRNNTYRTADASKNSPSRTAANSNRRQGTVNSNVVTKREVSSTATPRSTTVTKSSSSSYRTPASSSNRAKGNVSSRTATSRNSDATPRSSAPRNAETTARSSSSRSSAANSRSAAPRVERKSTRATMRSTTTSSSRSTRN
jgi:hypothetical protein